MTRQEEITLARMIDLRETLDKFEDKALLTLKQTYTAAKATVTAQLEKLSNDKTAKKKGLDALLEELTAVQGAVSNTLTGEVGAVIAEAGAFSYKKVNDITSWDGRVENFNNVMLSPAQITQLVTEQTLNGKGLKDWVGSALAPDISTIEEAIKQGNVLGDGYAATVRRIAKDLSLDTKQLRDLETVVKTYNQSIAVKAQRDVYRANKEVVNQVEWTAVMEGGNVETGRGTCPRCIALDGMKWALEDTDVPNCPLHARCRCLLLPVTKTWRELGFDIDEMEKAYSPWFVKDERGNKIESGRTQQSYHDWFASRGKAFQDKAIGPTRAELFRQGKLKLVEMVDQKGNLINVDQLGSMPSVKGSKPGGGTAPLASSLPKATPPKKERKPRAKKAESFGAFKNKEDFVAFEKQKERYGKWMLENEEVLREENARIPYKNKLLSDFYQKEFPEIHYRIKDWQHDPMDDGVMTMKLRHILLEKKSTLDDFIIREKDLVNAGKTRAEYIEMLTADLDRYAPKDQYIKARAFNQAYLDHIGYNEDKWLYRGTDGETGKRTAKVLAEQKEGAVFDYKDREMSGYSDSLYAANHFGVGARGFTVRIKVKKDNMFLHKDLLSGATGDYVSENEYIVFSKGREISWNDLAFGDKTFKDK